MVFPKHTYLKMPSALLLRELFPAQVDVNLAALELNDSNRFKKKKQTLESIPSRVPWFVGAVGEAH